MELKSIAGQGLSTLYRVIEATAQSGGKSSQSSPGKFPVEKFIFSSPQTRAICNDPFILGSAYTTTLMEGCAAALKLLKSSAQLELDERSTTVLHILRGGLNFGLREALNKSFGFNRHASAFVSAQRARRHDNPHEWMITENSYQKVSFHGESHIILGDVVATGTSLEYALQRIAELAHQSGGNISGITFFTIGGERSHQLLENVTASFSERFSSFRGSRVVYLEGIFGVAENATPLKIKIDGTDLLRRDCLMAPDFIESQYERPSFPLERCTIYDAGSRAFDIVEYLEDVEQYWHATHELCASGVTFESLLAERMPQLDAARFGKQSLPEICAMQLERARS